MKNKQKGFASIVALIIVAAALIIGIQQWSAMLSKNRIQENNESFYNRIVYLKTQFDAFATDKYTSGTSIQSRLIFPRNLKELEGGYIPECSDADNKNGYCFKYNQTPWGEISDSDYLVTLFTHTNDDGSTITYYKASIFIKLPSEDDEALKYDRDITLQLFAKMSGVRYLPERNEIAIEIDRPDKAFGYESLVKRSGDDSTLLGDWDVGGKHSITNVRDITIRNIDGTQRLVSSGLVDIFQVESGTTIYKPSCPQGLVPKLTLNVASTQINNEFTHTGSAKSWIDKETSSSWTVKLAIKSVNNKTGAPEIINNGVISAFIQCTQGK